MRDDAFTDENIIERSLAEKYSALFGFLSFGATTEVVCVNDLAVLHVGTFALSNLMSDELVEPSNADSGLPLMGVVVIVANVEEKVPVIKHADPG